MYWKSPRGASKLLGMSPPGGGVNVGLKSAGISPPGWTAGCVWAVRPTNAATRNANLARPTRLPLQPLRMARQRPEGQDAARRLFGRDRLRVGHGGRFVPPEELHHEHEE